MGQTMKAFVMKGIGKVGFMEKPIPEVGPNDALVRTTRALVCTSDVHTLKGAIGDRKDLTFGHEAVGIVARLGSEVTGFKEGDRVAANAITFRSRASTGGSGWARRSSAPASARVGESG